MKIPVKQIEVGANPRTHFDDDEQQELQSSIAAVGLIVPITVEQVDADQFKLVAGERRIRAHIALGINEIEAYVSETNHGPEKRVVENVVRSDLHPIEEGRAYLALQLQGKKPLPIKTLAKNLGINEPRVKARVRYAAIPQSVGDLMIAGHPLDRVRDTLVLMIEAFGAEVVEQFVDAKLEDLTADFLDGSGMRLLQAFDSFLHDTPSVDIIKISNDLRHNLPISADEREALLAQAKEKVGEHKEYDVWHFWTLGTESLDAANAYGVLRQFKIDRYAVVNYITDKAWVLDRIKLQIETYTKPAKEKKAKAEKAEVSDEEKAERKRQREADKQLREEAGRVNGSLGMILGQKLDRRKPTVDDVRLLVKIALDRRDDITGGWALTHPEEEDRLSQMSKGDRHNEIVSWVAKPAQINAILGRFFQVVLAASFASPMAVVQSKRQAVGFYYERQFPEFDKLAAEIVPTELYEAIQGAAKAEQQRRHDWEAKLRQSYNDASDVDPLEELDPRGVQSPGEFDPAAAGAVYVDDLYVDFGADENDVDAAQQAMDAIGTHPVTHEVLLMPDGWTFDKDGGLVPVSDSNPAFVFTSIDDYCAANPTAEAVEIYLAEKASQEAADAPPAGSPEASANTAVVDEETAEAAQEAKLASVAAEAPDPEPEEG